MNILQMTDGIPPRILGGAGRIVLETAAGLKERGHTVHILTAGNNPPDELGIRIHSIPALPTAWSHYRSVFSRRRADGIMSVIDTIKPTLIHAHLLSWQLGYRWMAEARRRNIPIIITAHDAMMVHYGKVKSHETSFMTQLASAGRSYNPLRNRAIRQMLLNADRILCVSDALRAYLTLAGLPSLQTLHNGINLSFWKPQETMAAARHALSLPPDAAIFLIAGRLGHAKGLDILLHSLPAKAHLIVAGNVDKKALISLAGRVHVYERQSSEDMRRLYAAADCTVVPSLYLDPFPTVCLESMAMNRPVLATTHGGAKEAMIHNKTGWIVDPVDAEAFRKQVAWIAAHRKDLADYGAFARKHVEQEFSLKIYVDHLEKIYTDTLAERK